ncbi:unnamed protein product, partial [Ectocarpus sp. 12 AP-2014]
VNALEQEAHGGDVVLFRCRGMLSRLQRWVLRTQWDHVGVVGICGGPSGRLELLESTHGGVHLYPLVERVRAYHDQGFASRVAFRRLRCPRPAESRARLEEFSRQVEGKRGSATANAIGETTTLPSFSSGKSEKTALSPSYLCSQLVGAALSEMGVLRGGGKDLGWLWVVPGAFGQGGAVDSRL